MIGQLIQGNRDLDALISMATDEAVKFDDRIVEYIDRSRMHAVSTLALDEGLDLDQFTLGTTGYTLKALGAGLWALKHAGSYLEGILAVIHEGGDADTNGAVAGALLGAKYGFTKLPMALVDGLIERDVLAGRVDQLLPHLS